MLIPFGYATARAFHSLRYRSRISFHFISFHYNIITVMKLFYLRFTKREPHSRQKAPFRPYRFHLAVAAVSALAAAAAASFHRALPYDVCRHSGKIGTGIGTGTPRRTSRIGTGTQRKQLRPLRLRLPPVVAMTSLVGTALIALIDRPVMSFLAGTYPPITTIAV